MINIGFCYWTTATQPQPQPHPYPNPTLTLTYFGWGWAIMPCLSRLSLSSRLVFLGGWPFTPKLFITSQNTKITAWNFQEMILVVHHGHKEHQAWPHYPCVKSGTLDVVQLPPFLTPHLGNTSNEDIKTKLSEYLPQGKIRSSMTTGMTMSCNSLVRNPQHTPSTPLLDTPFLTHFELRYQHEIFRVCSLG